MKLLHLSHIKRTYNANSTHPVYALKDINFDVNTGEYIAIMGESGAGKSTLLNIIATLEKASAGEILLNGQDLSDLTADEAAKYRREHLGFIFQHFNLNTVFSTRRFCFYAGNLYEKTAANASSRLFVLSLKRCRGQVFLFNQTNSPD